MLPGVSIEIAGGAITGLLGPSGTGKTTLIRAIVGVQVIESGEVTVLGESAGAAGLRARVGYVTQAPSVYGDSPCARTSTTSPASSPHPRAASTR